MTLCSMSFLNDAPHASSRHCHTVLITAAQSSNLLEASAATSAHRSVKERTALTPVQGSELE